VHSAKFALREECVFVGCYVPERRDGAGVVGSGPIGPAQRALREISCGESMNNSTHCWERRMSS
jgi:hypothetical protein